MRLSKNRRAVLLKRSRHLWVLLLTISISFLLPTISNATPQFATLPHVTHSVVGAPLFSQAEPVEQPSPDVSPLPFIGEQPTSVQELVIGAGKTAIATILLVLTLALIRRVFHIIEQKLWVLNTTHMRSIHLGSRELVSAEKIGQTLARVTNITRILIIITLVSVYLNSVLSFFPQTSSISEGIFSTIGAALGQIFGGFISYIPNLIFLFLIVVIAFYVLKFVRFLFEEVEKDALSIPGFDREWSTPTARIAQILLIALFAVVAFPYLPGSGSDAFQGVSIFLGLLISLGSSSAISNIIAGILLTYTRAFRIGDKVEIEGVIGVVLEKGLMVTRLRTDKNRFVSIPNANVLSGKITNFRVNYKLEEETPPVVFVEVYFTYDVPWEKVYSILVEAALETHDILPYPEPWVEHKAFQDDYIVYEVNAHTANPQRTERIRSEMRRRVHARCQQLNILMTTPKPEADEDENRTTERQANMSERSFDDMKEHHYP